MNTPNSQSSLNSWVDWLLHLHAEEIDLGLDRIRLVANAMHVTRPAPIVISVAGTNGKGSSVAMLASILKVSGYKVGTYTSPHILAFNERIQINGVPVDDQTIVDAFVDIESQRQDTKLTYFEFSTLAALTIFNQSDLDVVVLEVGLGGRLDAVNVVDADAALITAIDVDHIDWLGDDRNVIAVEKAGIMRQNKLAICSDPNPPQTLVDYANKLDVNLVLLGRDFSYTDTNKKVDSWSYSNLPEGRAVKLTRPALKGDFQLQNASGVMALLDCLMGTLPVSQEALNLGFANVKHAGRLESLEIDQQSWLIDVAHNPQSADVLSKYLAEESINSKDRVAVFSALSDKDMLPMVKKIAPFVSKWFIADLSIPRSTSIVELQRILESAGVCQKDIVTSDSIHETVKSVVDSSSLNVLAWGSFFTVAQTMDVLESMKGTKG